MFLASVPVTSFTDGKQESNLLLGEFSKISF